MSDAAWRLSLFLLVFISMSVWQSLKPARQSPLSLWRHWSGNFLLLFTSAVLVRIILPAGLAGIAMLAQDQQWGVFYQINISGMPALLLTYLILDLAIYWQHRLMHKVPLLWRLHKVHHADSQVDVSTGLRFHPLEIVLSLVYKSVFILLFGMPAVGILIFEIALNGFAVFNHANVRLPKSLDKYLSYIVITQSLHRIHHSQKVSETNSNYGFSVSWWDRLFLSYTANTENRERDICLGLKQYPSAAKNASLLAMLKMPFDKK